MNDSPTTAKPPDWHILGTGAIACLWGARLSRSGSAVTLLGRSPDTTAQAQVQLEQGAVVSRHDCRIFPSAQYREPITRLLIATKAYAVVDALDTVTDLLTGNSRVVLLQNGMGFQQRITSRWPQTALFCAVSTEGAWRRGPLHVVHAGRGQTLLGAWNPRDRAIEKSLCEELVRSGLDVRRTNDVQGALWRKLAINCVINPLTALNRCQNGELLDRHDLQLELQALVKETAAILTALGHHQLADKLAIEVERVARATASNRSSMLQDLSKGQRSEIDNLNGYLCRQAEKVGADSSLNHSLWQRVLDVEQQCTR